MSQAPFAAHSHESNFSLRETRSERDSMPARELVSAPPEDPQPMRAVAASRVIGDECLIEVSADDAPELVVTNDFLPDTRGTRASRVALRVAQRYPNALQLT